jgi:hypothetical protein
LAPGETIDFGAINNFPRVIVDVAQLVQEDLSSVTNDALTSKMAWRKARWFWPAAALACVSSLAGWIVAGAPEKTHSSIADIRPEAAKPAAATPQPIPPKKNESEKEPLPASVESKPVVPIPDAPSDQGYETLLKKALSASSVALRVALLREAIAVNPVGDEALAQLSLRLMESSKSRSEALALAKRAVAANDDNAMAWLAIGFIHQMRGKPNEARKAYRRCAASSGPKRYIRDCRRLI